MENWEIEKTGLQWAGLASESHAIHEPWLWDHEVGGFLTSNCTVKST